ncbi:arabinogalactan endo-1,4-beta-galactosidase [Xanthomonas cannabis]|uniref:arabinogalactan endo-1,4-beta-galactosidase n=1 Tax=Xanthomonas cannabis TaxID=1885674 RepID=UPI00141AD77B|nr:arabinogalactan endo-1,4-beta-galactosidase [Xanthomonas cannabis]MBB3804278.1 arabinogalactan endo-1,4-beta-galactosidase [Xanthomonas cannabis]NIK18682.1 arabinogalactan endo-1,4-beta-galactosidase [Xanthomonas cannabis]
MAIFRIQYHRVLLVLALCLCSAGVSAQGIAKGADVSWLNQQAANNPPQLFRDAAGNTTDFIKLFKDVGGNAIRLRVWVNPSGGWNDGRDTLDKAKRAAAQGMRIMIDFHYSDSWADPGKQTKPAAWAGHSVAQLNTDVYSHTQGILKYLKDNGITVTWVQVGNEINSGMLWNEGKTPNFANLGQFINSGYNATKAVYPNAKVIVHLANGYDNANFRWFFDNLRSAGGKWDVIGMSHYPPVGSWQDYNNRLDTNLRDMITRYGSDVVVAEVGMDWQQAATTRAMLTNLLSRSNAINSSHSKQVLGVFYWEPNAYPGWQGYTMGAVNNNGQLTEALQAF